MFEIAYLIGGIMEQTVIMKVTEIKLELDEIRVSVTAEWGEEKPENSLTANVILPAGDYTLKQIRHNAVEKVASIFGGKAEGLYYK